MINTKIFPFLEGRAGRRGVMNVISTNALCERFSQLKRAVPPSRHDDDDNNGSLKRTARNLYAGRTSFFGLLWACYFAGPGLPNSSSRIQELSETRQ